MITFPDEVKGIWQRKFTGATILFFINRYAILVSETLTVALNLQMWQTETEATANMICNSISRVNEVLTILFQISFAVLISLRTYAIWQNNRWIFAVVFILGLALPALNIYYYTTFEILAVPTPLSGCASAFEVNTFLHS